MADIRVKDLPLATGPTAPTGTDFLAIDGLTTRKTPISALGDVAVPIASQAEAEAGVNASKRMTPVTTKQSIASQVGTVAGTIAAGDDARIINSVQNTLTLTAGTGLTGGGDLSANRSFALNSTSIASLAKADSAVQRAGDTITGQLRITGAQLSVFSNTQTVPTNADNFGLVVTQNKSNGDGETNLHNMFVNGVGMTKAFTLSQVTVAGTTEIDLMTVYRNGRLAVGSIGWLEAIAGQAETVSMLTSLSKSGTALAITGASRTSDANAPAYFSSIGVWGFGYNNRARTGDFNTTFQSWAGYFENRRDNGSGRSKGVEIGSVNMGAAGVDPEATIMSPYDYGQNNANIGLLLSAGRPDVGAGQHNVSNAINIIANGAQYRTGINFGDGSVAANGFTVPALMMPSLYSLQWYTSEGLRGYVLADQSSGAQTVGMVIRNDRFDFEFQGVTTLRAKTNEIRALNSNSGFDVNAIYMGSLTATQQWQFQAGTDRLFLNNNTGTTASPVWGNRAVILNATGVYTATSDRRLKQDFRYYDRDVRETVKGVAAGTSFFRMKADPSVEELGFISQDVQLVLPEAITDSNGILMLKERPILAVLSLAVDDLYSKFEAMELAA